MTKTTEIFVIFAALGDALTSLYAVSFIAAVAGFHKVWFPSFLLFVLAVGLSTRPLVEPGVKRVESIGTGLLIAPAATAAAFLAATLSSYLAPPGPE